MESIIQWLLLFILALGGLLIWRGLMGKKSEASGSSAGVALNSEVEGVLKQILERTSKLDSVPAAGGVGGGVGAAGAPGTATATPLTPEAAALAETQVQALKKELATRDEELKALKASGGAAAAAGGETDQLSKRLKELESKLAEYEILEDDIADLSLYKEENGRLRAELEKLKGGAPANEMASTPTVAAAEATAAEPPAEAPPAAAEVSEDLVSEFEQAVSSEEVPASATADSTMKVPNTGNPMEDFEAAVNIEKKLVENKDPEAPAPVAATEAPAAPDAVPAASAAPTSTPTPAPTPTPETPPAPTASAADTAAQPVAQKEADDLFAEFAESPSTDPVDAGSLDTDKMMAEMAALVNIEPATGNALEEGVDTDKMAAEAGNLGKS